MWLRSAVLFLLLALLAGVLGDERDSMFNDQPDDVYDSETTMNDLILSLHQAGRVSGGFAGQDGASTFQTAADDPVDTFLKNAAAARSPRRSRDTLAKNRWHFLPSRG